ncbi:SDR family NAD(P)-dependent oxidoreductase [Propionispora hippei]|uniref:NAD(P)-dependent dehydrogenase, short-chain alcohol dehydrogenase family n=1 Tax=Propionispora hippei DSM 15287 TaxID=1123003 RepID=A0A1M6I4J2_9FIRM|nr:SDR family oxidoreductase [Propionispora hippei]SHJ29386.1 NAD(P)-dependent dehydrogenase, short-chain alcohol dehydrogenase family [Propionispora hippei DSM 15287]
MGNNRKIALVTGGSRGLGKNTAFALAQKGIDVIITYNMQKEKAAAVVEELTNSGCRAVALQLDVSQVASFPAFAEQLSTVLKEAWQREQFDFLINNAGIGLNAPFDRTTPEQFDSLLNIHFKGVFFLTQTLSGLLADNGGIVNFSTGLARFCLPGYSAYAAMKGAIEVLTKYLAKELGQRKIRVNVIAPGAIDTDFNKEALAAHPEMRDYIRAQTALGRMGQPDDIGGVVAALCTNEMAWVNAQRIEVSGGMFL